MWSAQRDRVAGGAESGSAGGGQHSLTITRKRAAAPAPAPRRQRAGRATAYCRELSLSDFALSNRRMIKALRLPLVSRRAACAAAAGARDAAAPPPPPPPQPPPLPWPRSCRKPSLRPLSTRTVAGYKNGVRAYCDKNRRVKLIR